MKVICTEIKTLEPIKTVAVSHVGDYSGIAVAFWKLTAWATLNNLLSTSTKMGGIYHDNPLYTPIEQLRSEAYLENTMAIEPGEGMKHYEISGGKYFVMRVETAKPELGEAWRMVYSLFNTKKYEYDSRDHYELYVRPTSDNQDILASWLIDLCVPMK